MITFVPTIPHTGTWFVLDFLGKFIPNFIEASVMLREGITLNRPTIVHTHTPAAFGGGEKSLSMDCICLLASIFKTVVPIRDPLASLLTREARHPEHRHFFIIDGFIQVAQRLAGNPNVKFLPIDLPWNKEQRFGKLREIVIHCDLEADDSCLEKIAERWEPRNPTPGNRFREMYRDKDRAKIERMLDYKIAEVEYLKNQAGIILPFLASLGYTKNDLDLW